MYRTATGAVLAVCLVTVAVSGFGFGSTSLAASPPLTAALQNSLDRTAQLQSLAGQTRREARWAEQRDVEAVAKAEAAAKEAAAAARAARAAARPARIKVTATAAETPTAVDPHGGTFLGTFEVTCYALTGTTASGRPVSRDVVAVDPRVIPMGSRITIEGVGTRTAADTGGSIKGSRLDIWEPSAETCRQFGRRYLQVWTA